MDRRVDLSNLTSADRAGHPLSDPLVSKAAISRLVLEDLDLVEKLFRQNLASPLDIVEEIGTFVVDGGGKRIRPTLHLMCAKLCRYEGPTISCSRPCWSSSTRRR